MDITLPKLPYGYDALAPHISRATLEFHHDKHHRPYVEKVVALAKQANLSGQTLESIIHKTAGSKEHSELFNNAAQAWNHAFYWRSLRPDGGGAPSGKIAELIKTEFKTSQSFCEKFSGAAITQFGSGWVWLVLEGDRLVISNTSNADTPLAHGQTPLLTIDVWEHAYYLDYQNERAVYVNAVLSHLFNWEFANHNLSGLKIAAPAHEIKSPS